MGGKAEFVQQVAEIFQQKGQVEVIQRPSDEIDIRVHRPRGTIIVQCEYVASDAIIQPAHIKNLHALKKNHRARTAYFVTSGTFAAASGAVAGQLGVHLMDKRRLEIVSKQARQNPAPPTVTYTPAPPASRPAPAPPPFDAHPSTMSNYPTYDYEAEHVEQKRINALDVVGILLVAACMAFWSLSALTIAISAGGGGALLATLAILIVLWLMAWLVYYALWRWFWIVLGILSLSGTLYFVGMLVFFGEVAIGAFRFVPN